MEGNNFIDSFREFIRECDVSFTEQGCSFFFPQHKLEIRLLAGNSLPHQQADGYILSQEPVLHVAVPEQILFHFPDILYLYQDRWFAAPQVTRQRIAARLGKFRSVFARKCKLLTGKEWQQLEKEYPAGKIASEADFLNRYHAYGYAVSKYRYALLWEDEIVAAATFSAPRPMIRLLSNPLQNVPRPQTALLRMLHPPLMPHQMYQSQDAMEFCSYEWIRYASLPGVRVAGGMGRLLKAFLKEVSQTVHPRFRGLPVEVMSYSDNEWSGGEVYESLGFALAGEREAVEYYVDKRSFERLSLRKLLERYRLQETDEKKAAAFLPPPSFWENYYKITNRGSRKYLLQPVFPLR